MQFVCPKPQVWNRIHQQLQRAWEAAGCVGPEPPVPLILNGWAFSSDLDKQQRWLATVAWANNAGLERLIHELSEEEGYWVDELDASPIAGPTHLPCSSDSKRKPDAEEYRAAFEKLRARWDYVAGRELAAVTAPFVFTGKKRRNLVITVEAGVEAPWGTWTELSQAESKRRMFTEFRRKVNEVIAPHKVDHVTFRERGA
jgi:hypothetical protein